MVETGQFATLWKVMAERLGLKPEFIKTDWRVGADPKVIEEHLRKDKAHEIKAVCVLHNETATGCLSPIGAIRKAIDAAGHPALFLVDTISSLASTDYRHDEWGVDVTVGGAQKGLMMPPGMSFNAVSEKALRASKTAKLPRSFFAWDDMLTMYKQGFFPYTPATQMLYGLDTAIQMLHEEGLDNVFARHDRLAEATRRAVRAWGLEILCREPKYYSPTITAVLLPDGHDADQFRNVALNTFNISYGASFGPYVKKYFRIGHLGDINDATLIGALAATEMALKLAGVPHKKGGVQAAMDYIVSAQAGARARGGGVTGLTPAARAATWSLNACALRDRRVPALEMRQRRPVRHQLAIAIGHDADGNVAVGEGVARHDRRSWPARRRGSSSPPSSAFSILRSRRGCAFPAACGSSPRSIRRSPARRR